MAAKPNEPPVVPVASSNSSSLAENMKAMRGSACSTVSALGPKKAGDELAVAVKRGLCPSAWLQKARTETVMMSAPHSLRSRDSREPLAPID